MEQNILADILSELKQINKRISNLEDGQEQINEKYVRLDTKIDHQVIKTLGLLLDGQKGIADDQKIIKPQVEANQALKSRVSTLEHVVDAHSIQINEMKEKIS